MRVGGKRRISLPPALGFGGQPVQAPFGDVPSGATVEYEVLLLRQTSLGPDELMKGITRCGRGVAAAQSEGCKDIVPAE